MQFDGLFMKNKIVIATVKSWNIENARRFQQVHRDVTILSDPKDLDSKTIQKLNPDFIFFPHWSWKIPQRICTNYNCVIFHIGDLPFGRGGSPLQNLIAREYKETKISAVKAIEEIDAGPIYLKRNLSLAGTAQEIFIRASRIIFDQMIPAIMSSQNSSSEQKGRAVTFKRRTPKEGNIERLRSLDKIYDYIRMLDAEGYPPAFLTKRNLKLEFRRGKIDKGRILAEVEITVKNEK